MTWKELAEKIKEMPVEQQNTDVTVLLMNKDEVIPVTDFVPTWQEKGELTADDQAKGVDQVAGVLDDGHPYMTVID